MKTIAELEKFLSTNYIATSQGTYSINGSQQVVVFHAVNHILNTCLAKLDKNEDIVDVKIFNEKAAHSSADLPKLVCFTDKCRMIVSSGNYYSCNIWVRDLKVIDPNKCRIQGQDNIGFFGNRMPCVYGDLILDGKTCFKTVELTLLKDVYNAVINNINEYKTKPEVKEISEVKELVSSEDKEWVPSTPCDNVAEIRKLYEDGIITREEMIDLIKSIGK